MYLTKKLSFGSIALKLEGGMNMAKLVEQFDTEEKCIAYLEEIRWPEGVRCLKCGNERISRFQASGKTGKVRHLYQCLSCRYQFSVRTGTIFHDSHLPLQKWFAAMALVSKSQGSISANQLRQVLGVQYKTAWQLIHRLREAMQQEGPDWEKQVLLRFVELDKPIGAGAIAIPREKIWIGTIPKGGADSEDILGASKSLRKPLLLEAVHAMTAESVSAEGHAHPGENRGSFLTRRLFGSFPIMGARHLPGYMNEVTYLFGSLFLTAMPTGILCPFGKGLKRTLETNFLSQNPAKG